MARKPTMARRQLYTHHIAPSETSLLGFVIILSLCNLLPHWPKDSSSGSEHYQCSAGSSSQLCQSPSYNKVLKITGYLWASSKTRVTAPLCLQSTYSEMCKGFTSPASDHFAIDLYKLEAELSSTQSSLASSPCTYSGMRDTTSVWSSHLLISHPCEGCKMAAIFFTTGIFFYTSRSFTPSIPSHLWWQNEEGVSFVEPSWDPHLSACALDFGVCF